MDFKELQHKTPTELERELRRLRDRLRERRFKVAHGQQPDVREVREAKKDIARLMTKLHQPTTK